MRGMPFVAVRGQRELGEPRERGNNSLKHDNLFGMETKR